MEKINHSQSVSSLRDRQTGLDPDLSGADSSTVSSRTSQLEFNSGTNRGLPSPEAIQTNSDKGNKQPVKSIKKKWVQEENRIVMECYYRSKPKINGYKQQETRNYVRNRKERLLIAAHTIADEDRKTPNEYKKRKKNES